MKKIIGIEQENSIECHNPDCDFVVKSTNVNSIDIDIKKYVNMKCPKCGENLLTEEEYFMLIKVSKIINWINKWFSWITYLTPKRKKSIKATMHIQDNKIEVND